MPAVTNGSLYHATDEEIDQDIDLAEIEQRNKPVLNFPLASALLLDGAPIVGKDKEAKLQSAIRKLFDSRGFTVTEMFMPMDEADQSRGVVFVVLKDPSTAQAAAGALDGFAFDKRHTLGVRTFDEVERLQNEVTEEFEEPQTSTFSEREHLRAWLADNAGRDQIALLRGDDLSVSWSNRNGSLSLAGEGAERKKWTESYTQWSPQGTYLATIHVQGIALWGGDSFDCINRFPHPQANLVDFSAHERYLVTWSKKAIEIPPGALKNPRFPFTEEDEGNHICIWEIVTGKLMRSFPMVVPPPNPTAALTPEEEKRRMAFTWPMFHWSGDERYFARVTPGQQISVYETPSFGLLGKKSVKIDGVVDFAWCPLSDKEKEQDVQREAQIEAGEKPGPERENVLAYWVPEIGNQPARVTLLSLPSRTVLRSKNLVNVSDCKIHWQSTGDFLCVKVDRHTKTKKTLFCNLELFRVREKGLPVETIDVKEGVIAFSWEPRGDRFILITTSDPAAATITPGATYKTNVSFYQLDSRKGDFRQIKTVDGKSCNAIFWSPKGRHVVTATLGGSNKFDVDFWDTDLESRQEVGGAQSVQTDLAAGIQLLASADQYGMTAVEWDPSGRYVTLAGTIWQTSMEAGYAIYSFAGAQIVKTALDKLKQMLWRPRPQTLLPKADQKRIRRNLRDYGRQFDETDALEESNVSKELVEQRQRLVDEWNAWRSRTTARLEADREEAGRKAPGKFVQLGKTAEDTEIVEEYREEVIEEIEEVVVEEAAPATAAPSA